jgi:hypothetical protein
VTALHLGRNHATVLNKFPHDSVAHARREAMIGLLLFALWAWSLFALTRRVQRRHASPKTPTQTRRLGKARRVRGQESISLSSVDTLTDRPAETSERDLRWSSLDDQQLTRLLTDSAP